ncbi:MAG: arginine deiminase-related protein [Phycisphaerales bacterium]
MPPACLCIRPARFGLHAESASTNAYVRAPDADDDTIARRGREEANGLIAALTDAGVDVLALDEHDKAGAPCPDSVFPNNWFSVHDVAGERVLVLYPMHDEARRRERWGDLRERLTGAGVRTDRVIDLTAHEHAGCALEGTGSLVFDHTRRVVYAARSPRTDEALVREFAPRLGVEPVVFDAADVTGTPVYHTNVLMTVADTFAIACLERIASGREAVRAHLTDGGRALVEIAPEQMDRFCANAIALPTTAGGQVLAMSTTAHDALTPDQRRALSRHAALLPVTIPTIEHVGGGSVRCMIAALP